MKELLVSFFFALVAGSIINGCMPPSSQNPASSEGQEQSTSASPDGAGASSPVADTSDDAFRSDVLDSKTPVLVDFWADWCGPCKMMSPIVDQVASEYGTKLKVVRVDVDSNEELTNKYRISALPTFMVFRDGKPVGGFSGATSKESLESKLSTYLAAETASK